jgi:DNA invertase Pin-like site-specific DNA recombinase
MLIGYARVSKADGSQSLELQHDALRAAGVEPGNIYDDGSVANIGDGRAASPRLGIRQHWQNAD